MRGVDLALGPLGRFCAGDAPPCSLGAAALSYWCLGGGKGEHPSIDERLRVSLSVAVLGIGSGLQAFGSTVAIRLSHNPSSY
jgi:hypothetical protein